MVTGFVVHWQRDIGVGCSNKDQATITVSGVSISYQITGLEEGNRYIITVNASNAAGNGSASNAVTAMTQEIGEELSSQCFSLSCDSSTAPTAPPASVTETTVTPNSVTVQWEEVPCLDRNGEITDYQVLTTNSQGMTVGTADVDVAARQGTISGLTPSTTYTVSVAAVNDAGTGPIRGVSIETTGDIIVVLLQV